MCGIIDITFFYINRIIVYLDIKNQSVWEPLQFTTDSHPSVCIRQQCAFVISLYLFSVLFDHVELFLVLRLIVCVIIAWLDYIFWLSFAHVFLFCRHISRSTYNDIPDVVWQFLLAHCLLVLHIALVVFNPTA